jgi:hypothetical protein
MNIDQRLEALTQTVELIAAMQRDNEKRIDEITTAIRQDAENIRALVRVAEIHHERLSRLEDHQ